MGSMDRPVGRSLGYIIMNCEKEADNAGGFWYNGGDADIPGRRGHQEAMRMILQAINVVLSIFVMIGLGMLLRHIGWLKTEHEALLSTLVVKVALPFMIVDNLFSQFTREGLVSNLSGVLVALASILACWAVARLLARLLRGKCLAGENETQFIYALQLLTQFLIGIDGEGGGGDG